jgi:hypothetical protein
MLNRKIVVLAMVEATWDARCLTDQECGVRYLEFKTAAATGETVRLQAEYNTAFAEKLSRVIKWQQAIARGDLLEVIDLRGHVDKSDMRSNELFARLRNAQTEGSMWNNRLMAAKNTLVALQQKIECVCDQCKDGIDDSLSQKVQTRDE